MVVIIFLEGLRVDVLASNPRLVAKSAGGVAESFATAGVIFISFARLIGAALARAIAISTPIKSLYRRG
jgi:hypothetical protein